MDLQKHLEFFDPTKITEEIHIIGCGAVGSTLTENLARLGFENFHLYDFDTVSQHNIANQMFRHSDIGEPKVIRLAQQCHEINPNIKIQAHLKGYSEGDSLAGYIFLCIDNIDLRREIVETNKFNPNIKAMFDFRMRLIDSQHYAADWSNEKQKENLLKSMQFSHEEAAEATPTSACGTTLNVVTTVRMIVAAGVSNFINFVKANALKNVILIDTFSFDIIAM